MMKCGLSSSFSTKSCCSPFKSLVQIRTSNISSNSQFPSLLISNFPHNHLQSCPYLSLSSRSHSPQPVYCSSSPGSGENDNKTVLGAFFLGKALGEALTERIESTVGEFLSTIGRLQAEQQKQVQEFQEDVLERAKKAKEKAAREALEQQGRLIPNSSTRNAIQRNGTDSSAPTPVVSPDNTVRREDEDRIDSDSISSITLDE